MRRRKRKSGGRRQAAGGRKRRRNPLGPFTGSPAENHERFGRGDYVYVWHLGAWWPGNIKRTFGDTPRGEHLPIYQVRSLDGRYGWDINRADIRQGKLVTEAELTAEYPESVKTPIGKPFAPRAGNPRPGTKLYEKTKDELLDMIRRVEEDPRSLSPAGKLEKFNARARARLEELRWAVRNKIEEERARKRNPKRKPALGFDEASAKAIKGRVQAMLDAKAAWTAASDDQRDEWAAAVNLPVTEVLKEWPDLDKRLQNHLIKLQPRRRNAPKRTATRRRNPKRKPHGTKYQAAQRRAAEVASLKPMPPSEFDDRSTASLERTLRLVESGGLRMSVASESRLRYVLARRRKSAPRRRNAPKRAATRRRNPAKATPSAVVRQLLARLRNEGIVADSAADLHWAASEGAHELYSTLVGMDSDFRAVIAEMKAEMRREDRAGRRAYAVEIRGWEAGLKHIRSAIHQVDRSLR